MEDFLSWFYEHYIKTTLSSQPPDFGTSCRADLLRSVPPEGCDFPQSWSAPNQTGTDLLRSVLDPFLQQQLEELNRFYALRSFRLGLRTGLALARDLEDGPLTPPPPSEGGLP